jgi:hypothetical protein
MSNKPLHELNVLSLVKIRTLFAEADLYDRCLCAVLPAVSALGHLTNLPPTRVALVHHMISREAEIGVNS